MNETISNYPLFSEATSEDCVIERMDGAPNARLRTIMESVVRHLHAIVKETELTSEEWFAAIQFLTRTGHMSNEWRQEFILLSDTLGISMLVDAINHRNGGVATDSTVLGPFHVSGAPQYANGANICLDGKGEPLLVAGTVRDETGKPIANAQLDVWQANEDGFYDVQQKGIQPDFNLRGLFRTDAEGKFWFRSVKPKAYPIPADGPVGDMLAALGRHPYRPAHIHFIVSAEGHQAVTTHLFDPDCAWLNSDAVFGVKPTLVADVQRIDDAEAARAAEIANPFSKIEWDFVLLREPG